MDAKHLPTRQFFSTNAAHKRHLKAAAQIAAEQLQAEQDILKAFGGRESFGMPNDFIAEWVGRVKDWQNAGTATRRRWRREAKRALWLAVQC